MLMLNFKIINDYKIFTKDFDLSENSKNLINQSVYQILGEK